MRIRLAEAAGACYGVQRALDMADDALKRYGRAYTLGPLIHNPHVVAELERAGAEVADESQAFSDAPVIIRSHGANPQMRERLAHEGATIIDATCPHVKRAQKAAEELARAGCWVLVVGEPGHPEVVAIREYAACAGARVDVVQTADDIPANLASPVGVVVQTTQRPEVLHEVVAELEKRGFNPSVKDTICSATLERQEAAEALAHDVDAMVVIGGKNSSNTTRLAEICHSICARTYHIESSDEIDASQFEGCDAVGVTAGASTPESQIAQVVHALRSL